MLRRALHRFQQVIGLASDGREAGPTRPAVSDAPVEIRVDTPAPAASAMPSPTDERPTTPDQMQAWLERCLERRCDSLRQDTAFGSGDALTLVDELQEPASLIIRQPPGPAQRALALTRDGGSSHAEIVRLVERDPALTQALLRFANSALYFTSGGPCVSLVDAVRKVGVRGVESVVLRCMVEGLLCRPGGGYETMVDLAWTHMVRTAAMGRALAPVFGVQKDEAYALALLHDVGKLVIFDRIGALRTTLRRDPKFPPGFISAALLVLHEPLGGLAALSWGLGPSAAGAVATHRRVEFANFSQSASAMLYVAERADLARARRQEPTVEQWSVDGRIVADAAAIRAAVAAVAVAA